MIKKSNLKAKLDKEFSLYIRLRDCMPNDFSGASVAARLNHLSRLIVAIT